MLKLYSIIVCYNPDIFNLKLLCQHIANGGAYVVIVDNTEISYLLDNPEFDDFILIPMGENTGIAHAQNVGIEYAANNGAEVVVFFDQDSIISDNFLAVLTGALKTGVPGVVAPVYFDNTKGYEFPSMRLNQHGLLVKVYKKNKNLPYNVDVVISSGIAATIVTFEIAGLMDEDFFIDFVDTEWCLRCRKKNVPIHVVPSAIMTHSIGTSSTKMLFFTLFIHGPDRCYYQIRNCFLLFRKQSIPQLLAVKEITSVLMHWLILFFFINNKMVYLKNYYLAISHGIKGVVGKKQ